MTKDEWALHPSARKASYQLRGAACRDCVFASDTGTQTRTMDCRFKPPVATAFGEMGLEFNWPMVLEEDWCGEFLMRLPDDGTHA